MTSQRDIIYRITFLQEDKVYILFAKSLTEETLVGFIEAEEFIFETPSLAADSSGQAPGYDELSHEFAQVKRTYIPQHLVLRIDEIAKEKKEERVVPNNVSPFPAPSNE